jgi:phosphohistidine phosphatase SixA
MADRDTVQLHLLRHAHAGDPEGWTGPDAARPLSPKGKRQAELLGRFLADVGFKPDAVITSPKLRAAQTAEIVAQALGVEVREDERLARGFDLVTIEAILFDTGEPTKPVLVGHDPDFSDLLGTLCGTSNVPMRKGAFARIDADRPLKAGAGTLRWLVSPDLLAGRDGSG